MSRWPALAAGLLVLAVLGPVQALALDPAEVPEANATSAAPDRPLAFGDCVGLALARSPFFKNSEIEIEVRGLDETDSRYKLLPKIKFRTQVYLNTPNNTSYSRHYTLEFATDNYNPVEAYFDSKARKIITKIASLSHLNNISDGLARLAERFLDLDALAKAEALDRELLDLARENTQYVNSRIGNGASAPLDTRIAMQREELAALELEKTGQAATALRQDLKAFMGLDAALEARFDLR
ncbi:MAG: hypothetical protein PHV85_07180, partial [Desulfovibrionaceae bacterium]|nr:hypothetical protein [Desulfovibrionaceae bacterium]